MFASSRKEEVSLRPSHIVGAAERLVIGRAILFHPKSVCRPLSSLEKRLIQSFPGSSADAAAPAGHITEKKADATTNEYRLKTWNHIFSSHVVFLFHSHTHAHFLLSELLWNYTGNFKRTSTIYIQKDIWKGSFSTCPLSDPL